MKRLYVLVDPRDGAIRYVGLASDQAKRLRDHCKDESDWLKRRWVLGLRREGLRPVLVDCGGADEDAEAAWIRALSRRCALFNREHSDPAVLLGTEPDLLALAGGALAESLAALARSLQGGGPPRLVR